MSAERSRSVVLHVSAHIEWWVRPYMAFATYVQSRGVPVDVPTVIRTALRGVHIAINGERVALQSRVDLTP